MSMPTEIATVGDEKVKEIRQNMGQTLSILAAWSKTVTTSAKAMQLSLNAEIASSNRPDIKNAYAAAIIAHDNQVNVLTKNVDTIKENNIELKKHEKKSYLKDSLKVEIKARKLTAEITYRSAVDKQQAYIDEVHGLLNGVGLINEANTWRTNMKNDTSG
ncbi:hypothetical protein BDV96DRAFT_653585 [Lophiotrema nucula]|uniref:Uncharacterized protein n=1 Tax=Lophiotrema nucula TaxID=690887 RepID=A0A6A5YKI1_9PLEO|nr:hypothetical protein BDV96DRAFT_653585 [Lophiotrema nucula]